MQYISLHATIYCRLIIRDAPDTDFARYPANLKAGYPVQAGYQISSRIFTSKFKWPVKKEIDKDIKCTGIVSFLSPYLLYNITFYYIKAETISRRHLWKFYKLKWLGYLFSSAGYSAISVSGIWPDIR
jgi:hypothetical protein